MSPAPQTLRPLTGAAGLVRGRFEVTWNGSHYVVDTHYFDFDERIHLYRDGHLVDTARHRARFKIGDGAQIEAAASKVGMKYVRLRVDGLRETRPLDPMTGTAEAWRERLDCTHPRVSRVVGVTATAVLVIVLLLELPQLINLLGMLAPYVGLPEVRMPMVSLTGWQNALVLVLGGLAGIERGLSMKYNPLLDD